MSTRVIDNPELIGWELDPSTGRWMWTGGSGSGGDSIEEAPVDNLIYGRQNAAWTEVAGPYDDTAVKADISANESAIAGNTSDIATNAGNISANTSAISNKLDADKIWTGTEDQYNNLSPNADTLYFITA